MFVNVISVCLSITPIIWINNYLSIWKIQHGILFGQYLWQYTTRSLKTIILWSNAIIGIVVKKMSCYLVLPKNVRVMVQTARLLSTWNG